MTAALGAMEAKIESAELDIETASTALKDARALRGRIEGERRKAQGRLTNGDASAVADLGQLARDFLAARAAVQEADQVLAATRAKVEPIKRDLKKLEQHEVAVHLAPLLNLRSALAAVFEAQATQLATTSALLRACVAESLALASLIGPTGSNHHLHRNVDKIVARRLLIRLKPELMSEFSSLPVSFEHPLDRQDTEAAAIMRELIEKTLAVSTGAGTDA